MKGDDVMKKEKLSEAREKGAEIAEILAYFKSKGFILSEYQEGYINGLLVQCRTPTRNKQV